MTKTRLALSVSIPVLAALLSVACSREGLSSGARDAGPTPGTGGNTGTGGSTKGTGGELGTGGTGGNRDAGPGCTEGGHTYAVGESFKLDCNTCTCTATGAACTAMACPVPDGGATDLHPAGDAGRVCVYNGKTYTVGESFAIDCNTCSCSATGAMCTAKICFGPDGAADLGPTIDASACSLSANLTFGWNGGDVLYSDVNRLTATRFIINRFYTLRDGIDGGSANTSCTPPLPTCGSASAVTFATITSDLADPDVQSLLSQPAGTAPLFGVDQRPADGAVYSVAFDDGHEVLVGSQCAAPMMDACRDIPAGLLRLTDDLKKLATAGLADPACKGL